MSATFDTVIRNGTIVDGSNTPAFPGDIAICDGRIVEVGVVTGTGREEIEAHDLLITPGFVDIHTHYDGQITWDSRLSPSSFHGITTVVTGNCGVGFAPCRPAQRKMLIRVMEGVEDVPELVMEAGLPWNWVSFEDFMDRIEERKFDVDVGIQVPHAAVRVYAMGERAENGVATEHDLRAMTLIVRDGLMAGALGVSSSRTLAHRTKSGKVVPHVTAGEAELQALALGMQQAGRGVFQLITGASDNPDTDPAAEFALVRRLAETAAGPLSFSVVTTPHLGERWKHTFQFIEGLNADGLTVRAQVFPRPVGVLLGLELSYHPFSFHPSYIAIASLPFDQQLSAMRAPGFRDRLLAEKSAAIGPFFEYMVNCVGYMFVLGAPPVYEPSRERTLGQIARQRGTSALALAFEILTAGDGRGTLLWPAANLVNGTLDDVYTMMRHDYSLIGLGDGGAHYGLICDSSYPTTMLTHWVRDRKGSRLSLEYAVHLLSRRNALAMGLADRGLLAPGHRADINVIDHKELSLDPPRSVYDLPAGGRRLIQQAHGYRATIVAGEITYRDGVPTGALPGRLLRGKQEPATPSGSI